MKTPIILLCGQAGAGKSTVAELLAKRTGFHVFGQADAIKELAREPFGLSQDALYGPSSSRNAVLPHLNDASMLRDLVMVKHAFDPEQSVRYEDLSDRAHKILHLHGGFAGLVSTEKEFYISGLLKKFNAGCIEQAEAGTLTTRWILQQMGTEVGRAADKLIWTRATLNNAKKAIEGGAPGVIVADGRFLSEVLAAAAAGATVVRIDSSSTLSGATHASEAELSTIPDHFFDAVIKNEKENGLEALEALVSQFFDYTFGPTIFEHIDMESLMENSNG